MKYDNHMNVVFLKSQCRIHKLRIVGRKKELIDRLNRFVGKQKPKDTRADKSQFGLESKSNKTTSCSNTECSICNNGYNNADLKPFMIIPCGHTYCKKCIDRKQLDKTGCPQCKGPINSKIENHFALDSIAEIHFKNMQLDANDKLVKVKSLLKKFEKIPTNNRSASVKEYFANIKNQVNMHYEETVQCVKKKYSITINSLDSLEKEALELISSVEKDLSKLTTTDVPKWDEQLKNSNIEQNQIEDLVKNLDESINNLNDHNLLIKNKIKFEPSIESKLFGCLSVVRRLEYSDGYYLGETNVDGKREGKGELYSNAGVKYTGEFRDDVQCGTGILAWADGDRYEGEFRNNNPTEGIFYSKSGINQRVKYLNGQWVRI